MTTFPDYPKIKYHGRRRGSNVYVLLEDYYYDGGCIPHGFLTDGVSVPRWLWWLFHPLGMLFPAALIHDYQYYLQTGTRREADKSMRRNVIKLNGGLIKSKSVYWTLRSVGWRAWHNNRKRDGREFWSGGHNK